MIKKTICLVIGFCMLLTQAMAQSAGSNFLSLNNSAAASVYSERHYQVSPTIQQAIIQERPGEKLRNTGITLLVVGGVLLIGGIALLASSPVTTNGGVTYYSTGSGSGTSSYGTGTTLSIGFTLGITALGHGIAALIAGGILTGKGAEKMKNPNSGNNSISE